MACNCATQEKIEEIYKAYGDKLREIPDNMTIFDWCKRIAYFVFTIIMFTIMIPVMFVYVLIVLFWKNEAIINVDYIDFVKLNKIIKNKVKECQTIISHIE